VRKNNLFNRIAEKLIIFSFSGLFFYQHNDTNFAHVAHWFKNYTAMKNGMMALVQSNKRKEVVLWWVCRYHYSLGFWICQKIRH